MLFLYNLIIMEVAKLEKTIFNVVSYSGGKDSTAMVLKMIGEDIPIDCIQAGLYGPGTGDALSV